MVYTSRCVTNCENKVTQSLPLSLDVECPICQSQVSLILWILKKENPSTGITEIITMEGIVTDGMCNLCSDIFYICSTNTKHIIITTTNIIIVQCKY